MKKILLIATGGTIASKYTKEGLSPQISAEELLEYIPTAKEFCTIDTVQPFLWTVPMYVLTTGCSWHSSLRKNMNSTTGS